jgi:hypothetical protein
MFTALAELLPRAALCFALLYGGASYLVVGPGIAARVVAVDYLPACERNHGAATLAAAEDRRRRIAPPALDPSKEMASRLLRGFRDSPLMRELEPLGGGLLGETAGAVIDRYEGAQAAVRDAYDRSLESIERETATRLAAAGTVCGCVADLAIADTRTEWAIYSGTFSLIRPAPLQDFSQRMEHIQASGQCSSAKEPAK